MSGVGLGHCHRMTVDGANCDQDRGSLVGEADVLTSGEGALHAGTAACPNYTCTSAGAGHCDAGNSITALGSASLL